MNASRTRASLPYRLAILAVSLLTLIMSGCSITLISNYDEVTDKSATELQKKVEHFLLTMQAAHGTSAGEYANNKAFYDESTVALSAMRLRAGAIPHNERTVEQIGEIEKNIDRLRQLHEQRGPAGLTKTLVDPIRTLINTQFKAILTLEIAKKRGT